jgi:hypothetical protein
LLELVPIFVDKTGKLGGVCGADFGDLSDHFLNIGSGPYAASVAKKELILWVEALHLDFGFEIPAYGFENRLENLGIEKESWAKIEFVSTLAMGRGASAYDPLLFEECDIHSCLCQKHGSGQAAWSRSDHNDLFHKDPQCGSPKRHFGRPVPIASGQYFQFKRTLLISDLVNWIPQGSGHFYCDGIGSSLPGKKKSRDFLAPGSL